MIQEILYKMEFISPIFYQVLYMTIVGSLVGLIIYFIRNIFDKKVLGKWKCVMWGIVLLTLLIPIRLEVKTNHRILESEIINRVENIKNIPNAMYINEMQKQGNDAIVNEDNINFEGNGKTQEVEETERTQEIEKTQEVLESEQTKNNQNISNQLEEADVSTISNAETKISIKEFLINIVIPYLWLIGTIIFIGTFISGAKRINNKIPKKSYKDERIENILDESKSRLNITKKIKIILQDYKKVPSIFGMIKPKILITERTLQEDDETIKYIFLHELSHYKRKDIIFNYFLLLTLSIHWFNPVVWFLFNRIRQDIEIGADELATKSLNKVERKEYGMVLINLLRSRVKENYTANLLCMSDTGKNMERRISMIKKEQKGILISAVVAIITMLLIVVIVFTKNASIEANKSIYDDLGISNTENNIENMNNGTDNTVNEVAEDNLIGNTEIEENNNSSIASTNISDEEKSAIEEYIYKICNNTLNNRLPEFDSINGVNKAWIYSHIKSVDDPYYVTKEQIEKQLNDLFGQNLKINVAEDVEIINDDFILAKSEVYGIKGKYALPITEMDNINFYIIDEIRKQNEQYIIKVVEFNEGYDLANDSKGKETIVSAYDENSSNMWKWKEIFRIDTDRVVRSKNSSIPSPTLSEEVLKRKNEFKSYDITITKNENGQFNVIKIQKAK